MEVWRDVVGYEGLYQVSSIGRVWSIFGRRQMKVGAVGSGYLGIRLSKSGTAKNLSVHRLVAMAFLSAKEGLQVNHIDGVKTNNVVENLEWVTAKDNMQHAGKKLLLSHGRGRWNVRLTEDLVREIRRRAGEGMTSRELAEILKQDKYTIEHVIQRRTWKYVT